MKNNKTSKFSLLILALALCLCTAFAIGAMANGTTPEPEGPVIDSQNIMYGDRFSLMYAIPADSVTPGASVTLYVHEGTEPAKEAYAGGREYTVTADEIKPAGKPDVVEGSVGLEYDAYVFITDGIGAKAFTTNFYVVAKDNATDKYSELKRYSVAEYLYERLADTSISPEQERMYKGAIEFGTGAQLSVGTPETDANKLLANLRYVVIDGGTIDGRYTRGVYPVGTKLENLKGSNLEAITSKWTVTPWINGAADIENTKNNQLSVTVLDAEITHVKFQTGVVINYRTAAESFDTTFTSNMITYGATGYNWRIFYVNTGLVNPASGGNTDNMILKNDGDKRGNYASITFTDGFVDGMSRTTANFWVKRIIANGNAVTAENATAAEISFDIKVEGLPENGHLDLSFCPSQGQYANVNLYNGRTNIGEESTTGLFINNSNLGVAAGYGRYDDVSISDWFHIRFVFYKEDTNNLYIYVNGSEEPTVIPYQQYVNYELREDLEEGNTIEIEGITYTVDGSRRLYYTNDAGKKVYLTNEKWDGNIDDIMNPVDALANQVRFTWSTTEGDRVLNLDNFFYGYTTEACPANNNETTPAE